MSAILSEGFVAGVCDLRIFSCGARFETLRWRWSESCLHFCGVSWGFKGRPFLENLNSEFVIDEPKELLDVMDKLEKGN